MLLKMKRNKLLCLTVLSLVAFIMLMLGGCLTTQEKRGYSSIPQNYPSSWEDRPMGDARS